MVFAGMRPDVEVNPRRRRNLCAERVQQLPALIEMIGRRRSSLELNQTLGNELSGKNR